MTQKDESPKASEGPYWSEELLAVLVVGLGDETQARETLRTARQETDIWDVRFGTLWARGCFSTQHSVSERN